MKNIILPCIVGLRWATTGASGLVNRPFVSPTSERHCSKWVHRRIQDQATDEVCSGSGRTTPTTTTSPAARRRSYFELSMANTGREDEIRQKVTTRWFFVFLDVHKSLVCATHNISIALTHTHTNISSLRLQIANLKREGRIKPNKQSSAPSSPDGGGGGDDDDDVGKSTTWDELTAAPVSASPSPPLMQPRLVPSAPSSLRPPPLRRSSCWRRRMRDCLRRNGLARTTTRDVIVVVGCCGCGGPR